MDAKNKGRIKGWIWVTSALSFSFSMKTPSGLHYRNDGFNTQEEAREAQDKLGKALEFQGEGVWKQAPPLKNPYYYRRGPQSSEDSYYTQAVLQGDSRLQLLPIMLPDVPGRIVEKRRK